MFLVLVLQSNSFNNKQISLKSIHVTPCDLNKGHAATCRRLDNRKQPHISVSKGAVVLSEGLISEGLKCPFLCNWIQTNLAAYKRWWYPCWMFSLFSKHTRKKTFGGWGIKCVHGGAHLILRTLMYFTAPPSAHFTPRSSRLRDASGALDDMSLRKIAVAKRLGKVFCMGIWVCLFEGVHLTSSLSRSDRGDSGGLLKAVSQTFSSHGAAAARLAAPTRMKQWINDMLSIWFDTFVSVGTALLAFCA